MSAIMLGLFLDVVVLICLGITIYYAVRLSKSLSAFRSHRKELNSLIDELNKSIDQAYSGIDGLKRVSRASGENLQNSINEARALCDELQIMNESANNLAQRLDLAVDGAKGAAKKKTVPDEPYSKAKTDKPYRNTEDEEDPFAIQDRDFGEDKTDDGTVWQDDDPVPEELQSQAERELFQALHKKKRGNG